MKLWTCPQCMSQDTIVRIDQFDGYACRACKRWIDPGCKDPRCDYCSQRPDTPIACDFDDPNNTENPKRRGGWHPPLTLIGWPIVKELTP